MIVFYLLESFELLEMVQRRLDGDQTTSPSLKEKAGSIVGFCYKEKKISERQLSFLQRYMRNEV